MSTQPRTSDGRWTFKAAGAPTATLCDQVDQDHESAHAAIAYARAVRALDGLFRRHPHLGCVGRYAAVDEDGRRRTVLTAPWPSPEVAADLEATGAQIDPSTWEDAPLDAFGTQEKGLFYDFHVAAELPRAEAGEAEARHRLAEVAGSGTDEEAEDREFTSASDYTEHVRHLLAEADTSGTVYTDEQVEAIAGLTIQYFGHAHGQPRYRTDPQVGFWATVASVMGDQ